VIAAAGRLVQVGDTEDIYTCDGSRVLGSLSLGVVEVIRGDGKVPRK
jgi:hypothetical protein